VRILLNVMATDQAKLQVLNSTTASHRMPHLISSVNVNLLPSASFQCHWCGAGKVILLLNVAIFAPLTTCTTARHRFHLRLSKWKHHLHKLTDVMTMGHHFLQKCGCQTISDDSDVIKSDSIVFCCYPMSSITWAAILCHFRQHHFH